MKLPVRVLVRLLYALDILDDLQRGDQVGVDRGGIADQTEDRMRGADALVDIDMLFLQPCDEAFELGGIRILL